MRSYHGFLSALKLDALIEIKLCVFSLFPIGLTLIEGFLKIEWYLEALIHGLHYVLSNTHRIPIAYGKIDT